MENFVDGYMHLQTAGFAPDLDDPGFGARGAPAVATLAPSASLAGRVVGFWHLQDPGGETAMPAARTAPRATAVLSMTFGPNAAADDGSSPAPQISGLQSCAQPWNGVPRHGVLMAALTPSGLAELLPGTGAGLLDRTVTLAEVAGDVQARRLEAALAAAVDTSAAARAVESWLLRCRAPGGNVVRHRRYTAVLGDLRAHGRVALAAGQAAVSSRQFQRWMRLHLGVSPKQLFDLARLQRSLAQVQRGATVDGADYSDQSHEIRAWKRRIGVTPGEYRRRGISPLARAFTSTQPTARPSLAYFL